MRLRTIYAWRDDTDGSISNSSFPFCQSSTDPRVGSVPWNLTDVTLWLILTNGEPGTVGLRFRCVLLEADRWIIALCPDCHFPRRAGIRVLGCFPLGLHSLSCPVTIAEQLRTRKQALNVLSKALNVRDLAEIIQLEEGTVRKHIRRGHVPYLEPLTKPRRGALTRRAPCYFVGTTRQIFSNWWHTVRTSRAATRGG